MSGRFTTGDIVRAVGHAGTWSVRKVTQGQALIERLDGDHHIAVQVSTLVLLRKVDTTTSSSNTAEPPPGGEATLFDES
jgi:hypothetical protein